MGINCCDICKCDEECASLGDNSSIDNLYDKRLAACQYNGPTEYMEAIDEIVDNEGKAIFEQWKIEKQKRENPRPWDKDRPETECNISMWR